MEYSLDCQNLAVTAPTSLDYFAPSNFVGAQDFRALVPKLGTLPRRAHQHHWEDWLEMHILRPHPKPAKTETLRGGEESES